MMYGPYSDYWGWSAGNMMGWYGGGIMMVIFWVLFIGLIVWIVREAGGRNSHSTHSSSQALNILKERYAKGEISKEEFESKKKDLS